MGTSGNSEMESWKTIETRLQPQRIQIKIHDMKTSPTAQTFGCFDVELRVQWLEAKGDPLSRLDAVIDWEGFRPLLVQALAKPETNENQSTANH